MKIPENVKESLNASLKQRRLVLATCSKSGVPNTVPIGIMKFKDDDTVILCDNYFLKTKENLGSNPRVAVTGWNMEEKDGKLAVKDGFQIKGKVKVEDKGVFYEHTKAELKAINPNWPVKAILLLNVEDIYDVKGGPNAGKKIQ
jgi:hypothetical protein